MEWGIFRDGERETMPRKKEPSPLAVYLTQELEARNMSRLELEDATGINDTTLGRILKGTVTDPKASQLAKIARALGIPVWKVMARANYTDEGPADATEEMFRITAIVADNPELTGIMGKLTVLGPKDLRAVRKYVELLIQGD